MVRKKRRFLMSIWRVKKSKKSNIGAPSGGQVRQIDESTLAILAGGAPPEGLKDRGLYSGDPTRQWAVGPANLFRGDPARGCNRRHWDKMYNFPLFCHPNV